MSITPEELALLTGAYAVDALSDEERVAMEAALETSEALRAEVASLSATALVLASATEPVEPPAGLKASLMAQIASTPQLPAVHDSGLEAPLAPVTQLTPSAAPAASEGPAAHRARARWFRTPARLTAVAAAALVLFLGGGAVTYGVFGHGSEQTQTQNAQGSTLNRIYAAADFQRASTPVKGGGTATVVWSDQLAKSAVVFHGVGAAPSGKTYELWYIGSKIKAAGLVNHMTTGVTTAVLSGRLSTGETVGVTVEPAGGSKQPTTAPIVAVPTKA